MSSQDTTTETSTAMEQATQKEAGKNSVAVEAPNSESAQASSKDQNEQDVNDDVVIDEETPKKVGSETGCVKWFNNKSGYGFITICDGGKKGTDVFVHYSSINPLNSKFKTLSKGEYVNFDLAEKGGNDKGAQAVNVTGLFNGPLLVDQIPQTRTSQQGGPKPYQNQGGLHHRPQPLQPGIASFNPGLNGLGRGGPFSGVGGGGSFGRPQYLNTAPAVVPLVPPMQIFQGPQSNNNDGFQPVRSNRKRARTSNGRGR